MLRSEIAQIIKITGVSQLQRLVCGLLLVLLTTQLVIAESAPDRVEPDRVENAAGDPARPLRDAWLQARDESKSVMLVLGADWCDRCALLDRYMEDETLNQRIDKRFVVLNLNVGDPDSLIQMEDNSVQLPVIVLLDSAADFQKLMSSDNLLTFLPDPNQPIYDWLENVLVYTEQPIANL